MFKLVKIALSSGLIFSLVIVGLAINSEDSFEVNDNVFIETASAMEHEMTIEDTLVKPLVISKIIRKKKKRAVRDLAGVSSRPGALNDDVGLLNEGKYSFDGLTFYVSQNGSVCSYPNDEVNGTLVSEYVYNTRLKSGSKRRCK